MRASVLFQAAFEMIVAGTTASTTEAVTAIGERRVGDKARVYAGKQTQRTGQRAADPPTLDVERFERTGEKCR